MRSDITSILLGPEGGDQGRREREKSSGGRTTHVEDPGQTDCCLVSRDWWQEGQVWGRCRTHAHHRIFLCASSPLDISSSSDILEYSNVVMCIFNSISLNFFSQFHSYTTISLTTNISKYILYQSLIIISHIQKFRKYTLPRASQ